MATYLPPVDRPKGLIKRITYRVMHLMFGVVPTGTKVFSARMPVAFMTFMGKAYRLDKKLVLAPETIFIVRHQVSTINMCTACLDIGRYFGLKGSAQTLTRMDALADYKTSPLFSDPERAALDYVSELTANKSVAAATFSRLAQHYSEREICDIVWLVASEHMANMANLGLGVGSDGLCELSQRRRHAVAVS